MKHINLANICADILLAPYGMTHEDLPQPATSSIDIPAPERDGEYELLNVTTEEVEQSQFLTRSEALARNTELSIEQDKRRWVPAIEEVA